MMPFLSSLLNIILVYPLHLGHRLRETLKICVVYIRMFLNCCCHVLVTQPFVSLGLFNFALLDRFVVFEIRFDVLLFVPVNMFLNVMSVCLAF